MENYTTEEIQRVLKAYANKRQREKEHCDKIKDTQEFKMKNREHVKQWYHKNKEIRKQLYENNKDIVLARASYNYYFKLNRVEEFKVKYPEKYKILQENHYFKEKKPEESTSKSISSSDADPSQ